MERANPDNLRVGSIADWSAAIQSGEVTSTQLTATALANAVDPTGEGPQTFVSIDANRAMSDAETFDKTMSRDGQFSPVAGIPISIKDLFDTAGQITTSGMKARPCAQPATLDAAAVKRLRRAGAVIVGKTNMTQFAYSGLGLNPYFGTPRNPYERSRALIPGGSSSGAAVSVTDGMAIAAIGSDTGGSVRIPAALCGLVGFKPTQSRMPMQGVFPLSTTLDTIGPIARTVECCASIDAVLSNRFSYSISHRPPSTIRVGLLNGIVLDEVDGAVGNAYQAALSAISNSGIETRDIHADPLSLIEEINQFGGFAAVECYAKLRSEIDLNQKDLDMCVLNRILKGRDVLACDYIDMIQARGTLIRELNAIDETVDALVCPTVPVVAPTIASLESDPVRENEMHRLMVRNPSIANLADRPAISIPCQDAGDLPVGLMLIGKTGRDQDLLEVAGTIERLVRNISI